MSLEVKYHTVNILLSDGWEGREQDLYVILHVKRDVYKEKWHKVS